MTRKRMRSNRFLPEYVTAFKDRHGKVRYRFRRKGYPSRYFTAPLGTEEFREEYARFNSAAAIQQAIEETRAARTVPGSIGDLLWRYLSNPERLGPTKTTQTKVRSILERFAEGRENRLVKDLRFHHIDAIIARARVKRLDTKGRAIGGVEAARKLRKELRRMLAYAVKLEWITVNPVDHAEKVKVAAGERSTGFHSWTEAEIAKYRARWPLGTKQRLAMELMLWTGQRKSDVIHLGPQHISDGKFELRQGKTGKALTLPIARQLMAAINAMPANGGLCFILTEWGRPFSSKGFGGWFRDQCDAAGLPHCTAHGLRKAAMRRMADHGMPNATLKAVSGHSKDDEVARYVQAADQERLASAAIHQISEWEMSNRSDGLDAKSAQGAENE